MTIKPEIIDELLSNREIKSQDDLFGKERLFRTNISFLRASSKLYLYSSSSRL